MKNRRLFPALLWLLICLYACQSQTEYCTVKGTVQGVKDGAELVLQDDWNKNKVISRTTVENGTFEFHPRISTPTRVYLYATVPEDVYANPYDGGQLKDFFLEPGTIVVDVHAEDGKKRSVMNGRISWLWYMLTDIPTISTRHRRSLTACPLTWPRPIRKRSQP